VNLSVGELRFLYNNREVLHEVSCTIEPGQIVSVLGPNGVGKTTLLKCLNRILKPESGTIYLGEENLLGLRTMEIARRIGYVPQRVETGRLTAFDAVLLGRRPHIGWDITAKDLKIVDAAFHRLSMEHLRLCYIDEMSGGELQKIAIARALVQEPKILLLDEPTSNLDLKNQVEILAVIAGIVRQHDIAAVMTMHDLNQALRFSDRFIFLKGGTVHLFGTGDDVTPGIIEEVYGIPVIIGDLGGVRCIVPDHCCIDRSTIPACERTPYDKRRFIGPVAPVRPD
jgi:ABC-type cobalamin/Fe3+-siderophores transport systems, ATPase components